MKIKKKRAEGLILRIPAIIMAKVTFMLSNLLIIAKRGRKIVKPDINQNQVTSFSKVFCESSKR